MSDDLLIARLRDRSTATIPSPASDEGLIAADVSRGRTAVRRTRYRQTVGTLGACAVAGLVATVALNSGTTPAPIEAAPSQTPTVITNPAPTSPSTGLRLVAYTGTQPEGFHLTTVPEGFRVIGSTTGSLVLAGAGDDGANPASFANRVVVMLASVDAPTSHAGTSVQVGAHPGVIWETDDHDGTRVLSYTDPRANPVDIQVWNTIKLTNAQLVEMASGLSVTDDAVQGVG